MSQPRLRETRFWQFGAGVWILMSSFPVVGTANRLVVVANVIGLGLLLVSLVTRGWRSNFFAANAALVVAIAALTLPSWIPSALAQILVAGAAVAYGVVLVVAFRRWRLGQRPRLIARARG